MTQDNERGKAGTRRDARRLALLCACGMEYTGYDGPEAVSLAEMMGGPLAEIPEFARLLVTTAHERREEIDAELVEVLENWQLSRIGAVERAVLRLGCCEIMHFPDIPPRVTINEYVELAKLYGDKQAPAFVNGILDRVAHKRQKPDFFSRRPATS